MSREVELDIPVTEPIFSEQNYVRVALEDAESMLQFASETGLAVDEVTKKATLDARAAFANGLNESTTANLLTALANLARMVSPVTPASLRVPPNKRSGPPVQTLGHWASGDYHFALHPQFRHLRHRRFHSCRYRNCQPSCGEIDLRVSDECTPNSIGCLILLWENKKSRVES